jgi:hypothetical protein
MSGALLRQDRAVVWIEEAPVKPRKSAGGPIFVITVIFVLPGCCDRASQKHPTDLIEVISTRCA